MKYRVDAVLRSNQAEFRANKSCVDEISTLRVIIDQSFEWQSTFYATFIDFQKGFYSIERICGRL